MYLISANVLFLSFFTFNEINKLRIISEAQNSDSPRLHHIRAAWLWFLWHRTRRDSNDRRMSDLKISIPHQLTQDEALRRIKSAIADAKKQYGEKIDELRESWNGNSGTLNVAAMGQKLSVVLTVNSSDVTVQSALPLIAMMFRGKIEAAIRQEGTKLLA